MKRIRTLILSFLFACAFIITPFASNAGLGAVNVAAAENEGTNTDYSTQYVVLSLEGFTLGQGFYITPERMSYDEIAKVWKDEGVDIDLSKLTVSQATYAFFKEAGLETEAKPDVENAYNDPSFYLSNIKGIDKGTVNVPQELKDAYKKKNGKDLILEKKNGTDLGEMDYFNMSGWMNTVDNVLGNVGAGSYQIASAPGVDNTHVIRWQFTLADYGEDLGYGYDTENNKFSSEYAYYETQDKTELYVLYAEHADEIAKDEALDKEVQAVMTDLDASADDVASAEKKIKGEKGNTVAITMNNSAPYMTLTDADGNDIPVGDPENNVYTVQLEQGTYRLSAYKMNGENKADMGSIDLVVTDEPQQSYSIYSITGVGCNSYDTVDGSRKYWKEGVDYSLTSKVTSPDNVDRHAVFVKTNEESDTAYAQYAGLFYYADMVSVTIDPIGDRAESYVSKTVANTLTSNRSYGYSISLAEARTVEFTIPKGTELRVGTLSTYYIYKDEKGTETESTEAGYDTYKYKLGSGITYYYRVTGGEGVTYWNWFSTKTDASYKVASDDMYIGSDTYTPDTVIHDLSANSMDVADIYMTSNEKGYLSLQKGDTYSLECFRNWQAIEGIMNARTAEPDYHYTVIDENGNPSDDVITVVPGEHSEVAEIQAKSEGTAILLVTYDAQINVPGMGGSFYSAIWPENTGVVVVTVGKDGSDIQTNMTLNEGLNTEANKVTADNLDAQIDVLYYLEGTDGAEYTFTPEAGVSVSVLRPEITDNKLTYSGFSTENVKKNEDGSYTLSGLVQGPNVVKVTRDGVSTYQVIRAKEVSVSYAYKDADGNEISEDELSAGDTIEISFGKRSEDGKRSYDGLYIPANKLSGIYNMAGTVKLTDSLENSYVGKSNQYSFAATPSAQTVTVKIPEYFSGDTFTLNGCLQEGGFGSAYGSHRDVRHATGKPVQMAASGHVAYMGSLPELSFKLVGSDFVQVNLKVVDSATGKAVEGYDIAVNDEDGNPSVVTDGCFNGFAGRKYNYTIKCAGYKYKEGSFDIPEDTTSISKTIKLAATGDTAWDGASMTEPAQKDGVYQIGTGAEFAWFANEVNVNKKGDINAVLTADIDLAGYSWTPIGTSNTVYKGTFDGQGHKVTGLYQNDVSYSGIFGQAGARISNLTVEGTIMMSTKSSAGAIVGYLYQGTAEAPARVSNCVSKVNITYTGSASSASIGGIAGYSYTSRVSNTVIENCVNYGTIKAENGGAIGGIIGSMISGNIYVQNSTNYGDVTGKKNVGGILGNHDEYYPQGPGCKIVSCYNAGVVTGQTNVGGIAGYYKGRKSNEAAVEITDCYSAGAVNGSDDNSVSVFAGYSEDLTISGSVYSATETADDSISAEEAVYVSPADISAVKKLTVDTVSKAKDAETIANVEPAVKKLETLTLSEEDRAFVELYKSLKAVVNNSKLKSVKVAVYDYAANAAKIKGASSTGVILAETEVDAETAVQAVEKALKENNIDYDIQDSAYGAYIVSVNGLASNADYMMSGWMLSHNSDDFANDGLSKISIEDGDVIELHYELTGQDVASVYAGLPTFETLTIGDSEVTFTTETSYDAEWNSVYTYKANGEVLKGSGTKDDPFEVNVKLFAGSDLITTNVKYKTYADSHYAVVDGLSATMDLTNAVLCSVTSRGGRSAWYEINAAATAEKVISKDTAKVEVADAVYSGNELTPEVTVYVSGNKLSSNDYTVTYSNNVNAGKASCVVTGAGDFTGSVETEFEIRKAEQTIANVPEDQTILLSDGVTVDVAATANTQIKLESDNKDVVSVDDSGKLKVVGSGTANITITAEKNENYLESKASFKITVICDIDKAVCSDVTAQTYTGEAITPDAELTYGDTKLVKDTDYTVTYKNNTSAGTATILFKGIGSYGGSKKVAFVINKSSDTIKLENTSVEVTEGAEAFNLGVTGHGTITFASSAPEVADVDRTTGTVTAGKAGTADITVTSTGTANYEAVTKVIRVTVNKKPEPPKPDDTVYNTELTEENTVIKVSDVTYTGKAQKPAVKVYVDGEELKTSEYEVVYENNVNAGKAGAIVVGKGIYTGYVEQFFNIRKADQKISGQTVYAYNTHIMINAAAKGKVTYTSSDKSIAVVDKSTGLVTAKKPGKVQIRIATAGNTNYKAAKGAITLVVAPKQVTVKAVSGAKKSAKVSYSKVKGATGYQVTYSANKNFKASKSKYVSSKNLSTVLKNLGSGKKYYVKVRAYKTISGKKYFGLYSNTKSVRTK